MSDCIVHYEGYSDKEDKLFSLNNKQYVRLAKAKECRLELGGENLHVLQSNKIPETFKENYFYHAKCYKKYTQAISRVANISDSSSPGPSRIQRTGDLGKILFPKYCMICKKHIIAVNREKQYPKLIELEKAELQIRQAAQLHNDEILLAAIKGTSSLRAAEFRIHTKCHKDYTRICPIKTKYPKQIEDTEIAEEGTTQRYHFRNRAINPNYSTCADDESDNTEDDEIESEVETRSNVELESIYS